MADRDRGEAPPPPDRTPVDAAGKSGRPGNVIIVVREFRVRRVVGPGNMYPSSQPANEELLRSYFRSVDTNGDGEITASELQQALGNGSFEPFRLDVVKRMVAMFDKDFSDTINFPEFVSLWRYVAQWEDAFRRADADRNGQIDRVEFAACLRGLGYRLGSAAVDRLVARYARPGASSLLFDDFIACCAGLHALTDVFRKFDARQNGYATFSFEQFVSELARAQF